MLCILHYALQIPYLVRVRQIFFFYLGTSEGKVDKWISDVGKFTAEHSEKKKKHSIEVPFMNSDELKNQTQGTNSSLMFWITYLLFI